MAYSISYAQITNNVEDYHFRRLYNNVLNNFLDMCDIPEEAIEDAITAIINSFKYREGSSYRDVDYSREQIRCGYIFRYAPHGAGLARVRILEALTAIRSTPELKSILLKSHLDVASLGGGPANDAIGFCSALSEYSFTDSMGQPRKFTGNMNIRIVDEVSEWYTFVRLVESLLENGSYGNASDFFHQGKAELNFKRLDLTAPREDERHEWTFLKKYDIILMCKLLSILDFEEKDHVLSNLYSVVKEDALILFIDSPFDEELWYDKGFQCLYISEEDSSYTYCPTDQAAERFGYTDTVTSKARIAVLKKTSIPPPISYTVGPVS